MISSFREERDTRLLSSADKTEREEDKSVIDKTKRDWKKKFNGCVCDMIN